MEKPQEKKLCDEDCKNLEKMCNAAGVAGKSAARPYLKSSVWSHVLSRLPWLIFLLFAAMACGLLVAVYENSFLKLPLLVTFIPLIMAIAGAGGSQTSTVIIRSMTTGEITTRQYARAFMKESLISLFCGAVLGFCMFGYVVAVYKNLTLGMVLWLGLIATVIFAKLLGMALPIVAKRIKIDPALIASPLVTIIADIFGIFVFFTLAQVLLGL